MFDCLNRITNALSAEYWEFRFLCSRYWEKIPPKKKELVKVSVQAILPILLISFSIVSSVKHSRLLPDEKHIEKKENKEKFFYRSVKGNFFLWHMWILTTFDSVFNIWYVPGDFFSLFRLLIKISTCVSWLVSRCVQFNQMWVQKEASRDGNILRF